MLGRIYLWSYLALDFCLLGGWEVFVCLLTDSILLLTVVCSYFIFLPGSVLRDCTFLGICLFVLGCSFYWHIVVCISLLWSFYFCGVGCNFSFFISHFIYVFPLYFFMINLAKIYQFFLPKEPALSFINLFYLVFKISFSFISALIFMISFPLLILGFVCSFFFFFCVQLDCLCFFLFL